MILFFGDSITRDWPIEAIGTEAFLNAGVAGETTGQMLQRFDRDVLERRPAILHLLAGINDIAQNQGPVTTERIAANLHRMVEAARDQRIAVVLGLLLPCTWVAKRPSIEPRAPITRLNDWIRTLDGREGVTLADYFSPLADAAGALRPDCTADGLHPNAAGYARLNPIAQAAIARLRES